MKWGEGELQSREKGKEKEGKKKRGKGLEIEGRGKEGDRLGTNNHNEETSDLRVAR